MRMMMRPWPEVQEALRQKLGYEADHEYEMGDGALHSIVTAGFDVMVRHVASADHGAAPDVYVSPGGRGFNQR